MSLKEIFGKRVKEYRTALFLSQEEFAEKLGIHRNTLARIENGKNFASYETIEKMQQVLNVEYKDLFTGDVKLKNENRILKAIKLKLKELNETDAKYFLININAYLKAKETNIHN